MNNPASNRVVVVPHTHWDREWYLPFEAFRMRLVKLIDTICDNLESNPGDRFHLDGQTIVLEDYERIRGRSERLARLIRDGRINIGPWYVQPDESLPSGEALIRNLQIGMNIAKKYGEPTLVGYLPDMFGHIGQLPQIFRGFGIKRAVLWRGVPASIDKCGFVWRSPDGSEVFSVFLPMGYSNGLNLDLDPTALKTRIILTRAIIGRFIEGPSWLLMAGTDHQQPKKELVNALKTAFADMPDWDVHIGSLPEYIDLLEAESAAKPAVTGELRDPHYAPILPSVGSTRVYIKQRDFAASSLIERYAEPLAAWVWALGGIDRRDFLNHTWKTLVKNHPHDTICGCSIDEVHRASELRYDRIDTVSKRMLNEAAVELARMMKLTPGKYWCTWTPAGKTIPTPVIAEIDGKPGKTAALKDDSGRIVPMQVIDEVYPALILGKAEAPGIFAPMVASFIFQEEEMLGGYMVGAELKPEKNALTLTINIGAASIGLDVEKTKKEILEKIAQSGAPVIKIVIKKQQRVKVAAVMKDLKPYSFGVYRVVKQNENITTDVHTGENTIENSYWRIVADDKGYLTIHDRRNNALYKNALKFVDDGDCGDEYNFEPVPEDAPIDEPVKSKTKILLKGPVAARMRIESVYRVPASLDRSGKKRSKSTVPLKITTDMTIYTDVQWIDFKTVIENNVRDHRLRVLFEAPFRSGELLCENAFEVTKRKSGVIPEPRKQNPADILSLLIGPETLTGYGPHRGFAAVENSGAGMAVFNRGIAEIEALNGGEGTSLALTLLRGVGSLSRDDMTYRIGHAGPDIKTPDCQCLGTQVCEFAFTSYKGAWQDVNLPAMAHLWRHPPFMFRASSDGGESIAPNDAPLRIDNPAIEIRALQPAPDGSKALCARVYNTTDKPQTGKIALHNCFKSFSEANLMGETIPDKHIARVGDRSATIELPPARIATLRLTFGE